MTNLASEIDNKTVHCKASPGEYLVSVWGGYKAPETVINCYNLQLEISEDNKGKGCDDVHEPNNEWQQASNIEIDEVVNGTISSFYDGDFYRFVVPGQPFMPKKDVAIHFLNEYSLGSVVSLIKMDNENNPVILANEIANQTVNYQVSPGEYFVWVWGGYKYPETFINCYKLQVKVYGGGEKGSGVISSNSIFDGTLLSEQVKVYPMQVKNDVNVDLISLGAPFAISIYDLQGNLLHKSVRYEKKMGMTSFNIPFRLQNGNYILRLEDGYQKIEKRLLVRN